jgi:hypothetical protein
MKKNRTWFIALGAAAFWLAGSGPAAAQVTLTKNSDLNFGNMVAGGSAGTVTISTAGAVSSTGGATLVPSSTSAATFTLANPISGTSRFYFIQIPTTVTITSGANTMTVNGFQSNPPNFGTLAAGSSRGINVGATLNVGANQPSGTYTGTFSLTVFLF